MQNTFTKRKQSQLSSQALRQKNPPARPGFLLRSLVLHTIAVILLAVIIGALGRGSRYYKLQSCCIIAPIILLFRCFLFGSVIPEIIYSSCLPKNAPPLYSSPVAYAAKKVLAEVSI